MDAGTLADIAYAGVAVLGLVLAGMAILAARRVRSLRMVCVAVGFLLIAVQGLYIGVSLFWATTDLANLLLASAIFEAAVLIALFLATLMR
jgi:hypothetical protein